MCIHNAVPTFSLIPEMKLLWFSTLSEATGFQVKGVLDF
jgi:hypothetical protein